MTVMKDKQLTTKKVNETIEEGNGRKEDDKLDYIKLLTYDQRRDWVCFEKINMDGIQAPRQTMDADQLQLLSF